jgi:RNA polymerase sigma-70 factor (ECF subfamily)
VDTAAQQPDDLILPLEAAASLSAGPGAEIHSIQVADPAFPEGVAEQLWRAAEGSACGITPQDFANILNKVGSRCNHGFAAGIDPGPVQKMEFYKALRLPELALAHACAMGSEIAWERFLSLYRATITQAAKAITRSSSLGEELADSLYAELFGLKDREGLRISPLASYSGRGSLLGWLRTTLAQRHIDAHRRTYREEPLADQDPPAVPLTQPASAQEADLLGRAVARTVQALDAADCFLLSSYFLDRRTLMEIARLLKVHEATISRRLKRLTEEMRKQLLLNLRAEGLSQRQAEEALGADPRDIEINLRGLLQKSQVSAFPEKREPAGSESR